MSLGKIGIGLTVLLISLSSILLFLEHPGRALQIGNYALILGTLSSLFITLLNSNE